MRKIAICVHVSEEECEHDDVIDRKLVWHGGMNLLGKVDANDNLIRVENEQVAAELLEMTDDILDSE